MKRKTVKKTKSKRTRTYRGRTTAKSANLTAFSREFRTCTGMSLDGHRKQLVAAMTAEQIAEAGVMLQLAWNKGYRTGGYHKSNGGKS